MSRIYAMLYVSSFIPFTVLILRNFRGGNSGIFGRDFGEGRYAYGGAWEKTYVYNDIGEFINLFGGDYYDWTNPKTREAIEFLKNCVEQGYAPMDQLLVDENMKETSVL